MTWTIHKFFQRPGLIAWMALLLSWPSALAASPDDAYLEAYLTMQDAATLEQAGDLQGAIRRLGEARQQFARVQANWPEWNPSMVAYRLEKVQESVVALNAKLGGASTGSPALGPFAQPTPLPPPPAVTTPMPPPATAGTTPMPPVVDSNDPLENIRARMQALEQENQAAREENQRLRAEVQQKESAYQEMLNQVTSARQKENDLQVQITALEGQLELATDGNVDELVEMRAQLTRFRQDYASAQEAADEAETRAAELAGDLEETRGTLELIKAQAESMEAEDFPTRIAELTTQNQRLRQDLESARERIGVLEEEAEEKDAQIVQLQENLQDIRQQLALLKQENVRYQAQVAELTSELREARDRIAALPEEVEGDPELMAENQMLRQVIMRQLRTQARQQQAKALIIEELESMDQVSSNLLTYVNDLTSLRVVLTEEEKAMFQEPQLQDLLGGGDTDATVMAPATGEGDDQPAPAPAPSAEEDDELAGSLSDDVPVDNRAALVDLLRQARNLAGERDFAGAEAAYQDFLRADPRNVDVLCNLGVVKMNLGKLDDAEVVLMRALEFSNQRHAGAHFYLGVSQFRRNQMNEAFASIEESLRQDANNAQARHFLGVISSRLGMRDRAQAEFKSAIAIEPDYAAAHFNLAVLYATVDPPDYEAARKYYLEAVLKGASRDDNMERLLAEHVSMDTVAN